MESVMDSTALKVAKKLACDPEAGGCDLKPVVGLVNAKTREGHPAIIAQCPNCQRVEVVVLPQKLPAAGV